MLTVSAVPELELGDRKCSNVQPPERKSVPFRYTQTESFVDLLQELGATLLVSTYQANKLLAIRADRCGLSMLVRSFDRPMGIAVVGRRLALGTRGQVVHFRDAPDIAPRIKPAGRHDACYLPRFSHVTGDVGIHEMAWAGDELWLVNTRFSCLCTLDADYNFVPRWKPPFVTALAAEDRCHLNGLSIVDGRPKFATALGATNVRDGWRPGKVQGGVLVDVPSGDVVTAGMSMPHSPRWHDGRLWVLESGTGELHAVESDGRQVSVAGLPGFVRGLAIAGPYAFVGLSKIRQTSAMAGVPISERRGELKCGVAAVDLRTGCVVGSIEFQSAVEEIFDVQLLPGVRFPELIGFQNDDVFHTFVVPPTSGV